MSKLFGKTIVVGVLVLSVLIIQACQSAQKHYQPQDVYIQSIQKSPDGTTTITFDTMAEDLWWCDGVDVSYASDGIQLKFRRSFKPSTSVHKVVVSNPKGLLITITDGKNAIPVEMAAGSATTTTTNGS